MGMVDGLKRGEVQGVGKIFRDASLATPGSSLAFRVRGRSYRFFAGEKDG
jgi:hypothetical protein